MYDLEKIIKSNPDLPPALIAKLLLAKDSPAEPFEFDEADENYRGLIETIYLHSQPRIVEEILQAEKEPISECVPTDDVEW